MDRNDHYIPSRPDRSAGSEEDATTPIERSDASEHIIVTEGGVDVVRPVAFALADELNRDPSMWWWTDYHDESGDHWSHMSPSAHHIVVDVEISQSNRRETHDWKGYDDIRGSTVAKVFFDRKPVWERSGGPISNVLRALDQDIGALLELDALRKWVKGDAEGLIGRKIFYREIAATITSFIGDQGCVIMETEDGEPFPVPAYARDEIDPEEESSVKDLILSPHIWWWRD